MNKPEIEGYLANGKLLMRLGTVDGNGDPQIHPVWYHYANDKLYLMTRNGTRKAENIKRKSTLYFSIDTEVMPYRGVKGRGTARIVKETEKVLPIVEKIVTKYLGDTKSGLRKGIVDAASSGSEIVIEIIPSYYSVWDYGKTA